MTEPGVRSYSVEAYNISHASENKIHDDAVAQKLGFSGGLVPGVEVYGYMTHLALAQWGRSWLERGDIEARFLKPVYDGKTALASAHPAGNALELEVHSDGIQCATGRAALGDAGQPPPALGDFPQPTPPQARPPADEASLAPGVWLASAPVQLTAAVARDYLRDVRERSPIYAEERLAHPGWLLRQCNSALKDNVALAPWIHTGSKVRNFAAVRVGAEVTARARVLANYERKGHRLVDLDCLVVADGTTVAARVLHTAVYRLRQLAGT